MTAKGFALKTSERKHSPIGPSSFERAEACSASVLTEGRMKRASVYADEGTVAHQLFEVVLRTGESAENYLGTTAETDSGPVEIDRAMVDHITDMAGWVRTNLTRFDIERRLIMRNSRMYGYADIVGVDTDGVYTVPDLKYGFQWVNANAPQLAFYAMMAMAEDGIDLSILKEDSVVARTVVMQPRLDNPIRDHKWTVGDLRALRARLHELEGIIDRGEFTYQTGAHCRWCDRAATCPALRLLVEDAAMSYIVADPEHPSTQADLEKAASLLPALKVWVKAVEEQVAAYLNAGGTLPSARMVVGRNNRSWKDENEAAMLMELYGVEPNLPGKLRSPAQAETALPKGTKKEIAELVATVRGNPTVEYGEAKGQAAPPSLTAMEMAALVPMAQGLLKKAVDAPQ
jgi:hypothetical protein